MAFVRPLPSLHTLIATLRTTNLHELEVYIHETCRYLDTIDPYIHGFLPDPGRLPRLLSSAAALQVLYPNSAFRPPLYGVLLGIKDIFATSGLPTLLAGSRLPSTAFAHMPEPLCVTKLKSAGALILGKTETSEFAYYEPAPTRNPHAPGHTPGGSSSGSAAAVAAGVCVAALGTQTNGSIARPAAYCGIVGLKPSHGRIEVDEGLVPCAPSADTVGILARDVDSAEIVAGVLCRGWAEGEINIANSDRGRIPVLGVPDDKAYLSQVEPEALAAFENTIEILRYSGYAVHRVPLFLNITAIDVTQKTIVYGEMALAHEQWFADYAPLYRTYTRDAILAGRRVSAITLDEGRASMLELRARIQNTMRAEGIDLWVCPAATGPAPLGLASTGSPAMNVPWSHAGLPVVVVPAGRIGRLPVGVQIVGRYWGDEEVVRGAEGIEKVVAGGRNY